jgi:uncharacterized coiled-coil DUF342 family protein
MNTEEFNKLKDLRSKAIKLQTDISHINRKRKQIVEELIKTNKEIAELRKKI